MTAGTVVITGGILATVILLCIIAVLCYCRLQVWLSIHHVCKCLHLYTHLYTQCYFVHSFLSLLAVLFVLPHEAIQFLYVDYMGN